MTRERCHFVLSWGICARPAVGPRFEAGGESYPVCESCRGRATRAIRQIESAALAPPAVASAAKADRLEAAIRDAMTPGVPMKLVEIHAAVSRRAKPVSSMTINRRLNGMGDVRREGKRAGCRYVRGTVVE